MVQGMSGVPSSQGGKAVQPIPVPAARFTHMHVDLVGLLPTSAEGYHYQFIIMVDRSNRC